MKKVNFLRLSVLVCASAACAATLEGLPGELFIPSARPLGHLALYASASATGHEDESMVRDNIFLKQLYTGFLDSNQVQDMQSAAIRLNFAMGIGSHFDVGLSIPYYGDFITDTEAKELSGSGLGDPLLSVKGGYAFVGDHVLDGALLAGLTFPSKNGKGFLPKSFAEMPDDSTVAPPRFFSTYGFGWSARALLTLDLTRIEPMPLPFRSSLNAGFANSGLPGARERFLLGGDLEWVPLPYLSFLGGAQSETRTSEMKGLDAIGKEYSYAFAGFSSRGDDGIFFSVNLQKSLPSARPFRRYALPANYGVYAFAARFQPRWGLAANIGWSGAFVAEDADHDGIPDKEDTCPNEPEDKDGFQDADGCPDPDNDNDKIPDLNDKCPNEPETYNGFEDGDGCPDEAPGKGGSGAAPLEKRSLLKSIHFLGNTDKLLPESFVSLDSLAERIRAIPGVMVEVRGYWDGAASELDGMRSSEARANAVRKYLVSKGIPPDQILARGLGARDPIDNNRTAIGRQRNRRVELVRLN